MESNYVLNRSKINIPNSNSVKLKMDNFTTFVIKQSYRFAISIVNFFI